MSFPDINRMQSICIVLLFAFIIEVPVSLSAGSSVLLASFSSDLADQTVSVKQNIQLASDKLDGVVISPGDIFNFNDIVGEGNAVNGFVDGAVLYRDGIRMEPGGGLCQVSSTVFNAMLMAGFRIVERYRHFQPVTYVPLGLDATIKYGKKNLRMKSTLKQPVTIRISMNEKSLTAIIMGRYRERFTYVVETDQEELSLPFQENEERGSIRPGMNIYIYRKKMKGNRVIERFLMYRDFYRPVYLK